MQIRVLIGVVCLLGFVTGSVAFAQQDVICVCLDPNMTDSCGGNTNADFLGHVIARLCIVNPSNTQVKAWEALVEISNPAAWVGNWLLAGGANYATPPEFVVGAGADPLYPNAANVVLLASIDLLILDVTNPIEIFVRGIPGSLSFPDGPGYSWEAGFPVPLSVCSGDQNVPLFTINGPYIPPLSQFSVTINASSGGVNDDGNIAGATLYASDGYDPSLDVPEPPPAPTDYVSLYFPHPEWGTVFGDNFMSDVRAPFEPTEETKIWTFAVKTDMSSNMSLSFVPSIGFDSGWGIYLHDPIDDWTIDLRLLEYEYVYVPTSDEEKHFELWVGPQGIIQPEPAYRDIPAGWSLIGMPLIPPDPGTIEAAILQWASGVNFVYDYEPAQGYRHLLGAAQAVQGKALWVGSTLGFTWEMPSGIADADGVSVPLNDGWTMVGYPLWIPSAREGVYIQDGNFFYSWAQAVEFGWVSDIVFEYSSSIGGYETSADFQTWHGYWVAAYDDDFSLWFHYPNVVDPGDVIRSPIPTTDQHWRLAFSLNSSPCDVAIGVSKLASAGFDARYDFPAPPEAPISSQAPKLYFEYPEWDLSTGDTFITDFRSPTDPPYQWEALLTSPAPGSVVLNWDGSALPEDTDLQVYLPQQNRVVVMSMRDESSVTLDVGAEPLQVVFRSPDMSTGIADAPGRHTISCHPNPFNPTTEIELRTVAAGHIDLEIYDLRGRRVRSFTLGEQPAGTYRATWRGRDDDGREVAGGTYFAVLALDGVRTGTLAKLTLVR